MAPGNRSKGAARNGVKGARKAKRKAAEDLTKGKVAAEADTEIVFEDPFGDDFESDEEHPSGGNGPAEPPVPADSPNAPMVRGGKMIYRPGIDKLREGETLVCDESAYDILHRVTPEWPWLSFDFVCYDTEGGYRNMSALPQNTYPMSVMAVLGTQAGPGKPNKLQCVRLSNMRRTRKRAAAHEDDDASDSTSESDSDDSDDDDNIDTGMEDGILQTIDIRFDSVINRVRCMPQRSNVVAVWGESGRVSLMDVSASLDALNRDAGKRMVLPKSASAAAANKPGSVKPFQSFNGHRNEGFGVDWSPCTEGRLATGAVDGSLYVWEPSEGGMWMVSPDRYRGHRESVEDIQWSPNECNVFATCSVDRSICFWDTRQYRKPAVTIAGAHADDVNVISWNGNESHLVVSGGDDCAIKVWDLRALQASASAGGGASPPAPAAEFLHHKMPITSVEWHPRDASMLAASSEDGTVSIWDLAVERDAEEELRDGEVVAGADEYPPQLLFLHMGQKNTKELHWHPGCNSLLTTTAEDGLNVFKPANISLPM